MGGHVGLAMTTSRDSSGLTVVQLSQSEKLLQARFSPVPCGCNSGGIHLDE
jgi:hypothetical protein